MVPVERFHLNDKWNVFENAATHSYARSVLERNRKKISLAMNDSQSKRKTTTESNANKQAIIDERQTMPTWQEEVTTLKTILSNTQKNLDEV